MKNEVSSHVLKVLQEVDAEIKVRQDETQQLVNVRSSLMELYNIPASLPMGNVKARQPRKSKSDPVPDAPAAPAAEPAAPAENGLDIPGRELSAESVRILSVMRTAPEPFTIPSLIVSTGLEKKVVSGAVQRSRMKGWISAVTHGQYKRTGTFPATT